MKTSDSNFDSTLMDRVKQIMRQYDPDPLHAIHVAELALQLFDALQEEHWMDPSDKNLLQIATLLHDIGRFSKDAMEHHLSSFQMILSEAIPGLSDQDKLICALIARYHRDAEPDTVHHHHFATLSSTDQNRVEWLAGILRVADGLDRGHMNTVESLACEKHPDRIVIYLRNKGSCYSEISSATRKGGLLEKKARKHLDYQLC